LDYNCAGYHDSGMELEKSYQDNVANESSSYNNARIANSDESTILASATDAEEIATTVDGSSTNNGRIRASDSSKNVGDDSEQLPKDAHPQSLADDSIQLGMPVSSAIVGMPQEEHTSKTLSDLQVSRVNPSWMPAHRWLIHDTSAAITQYPCRTKRRLLRIMRARTGTHSKSRAIYKCPDVIDRKGRQTTTARANAVR